MSDGHIQELADNWVAQLDATDHPEELWPDIRPWLDENPAHLVAFRSAESLLRIANAAIRNLAPAAGAYEFQAFMDTLDQELAVCPDLFAK